MGKLELQLQLNPNIIVNYPSHTIQYKRLQKRAKKDIKKLRNRKKSEFLVLFTS